MRRPRPERVSIFLEHILQAIDRIREYTDGMDNIAFLQNTLAQDAVILNFEVIGEASHRILRNDPSFEELHPEIPWRIAYGMRNVLTHGYDAVLLQTVWDAQREHLLRSAVIAYLKESRQPLMSVGRPSD